ncbi:MAG: hypothetical protein HQM16_14875 [Deltaproteobacteria bacterium]|nr:hypothetical protein [Deltaproteobacteria bacterium]
MEDYIPYIFRFVFYTFFGLTMEMIFSVHQIDTVLGFKLNRRVPKKYLEGFVSLTMIPLHGFGLLFGFEYIHTHVHDWFILYRFCVWAVGFTCMEILWGVACEKVLGFYSWDYYADSKFRIFKKGYSLWTLVPLWGVAGIIMEFYSGLLIHLSPYVASFVRAFF